MKRTHINSCINEKWRIPLLILTIFFILFFISISLHQHSSTPPSTTNNLPHLTSLSSDQIDDANPRLPNLPRFAYLLSGSKGDVRRLKRLFQALYHPRNYYVLHLDFEASDNERMEIAKYVKSASVVREFSNVMVIGKPDLITHKGPSAIASTLHAVALLLVMAKEWDWFINLSAWDYPLIPQDDLLHIFSYLPKDLNFLEHTSDIGWKENERARPIIIDPGLYHTKKSGVFWAKERRSLPASFKLFTGSEWVVLTKPFLEFCVMGWDNLPRTLLMYYTNFLASAEGYFHTVVCNHKNYQNTTVNHNLHYLKWDHPPKHNPVNLTLEHFDDMVQSGAPFARRFSTDDPVLKKIDRELLRRPDGGFTPGGWCLGNPSRGLDPCLVYGRADVIKPSVNSKRFEKLVLKLLDPETFRSKQCR